MALFTDGLISTIEDLVAHDSAALDVAGTEGIDLTNKLDLAQDEIGVELLALLPRSSSYDQQFYGSAKTALEFLVITQPVKLWHVFQTLTAFYRDAYNSQLNDRYRGKWLEYKELVKWAARKVVETGVGMVWDPVPQAKTPQLSAILSAQPAATYYVTTSWLNSRGEEGMPAVYAPFTVEAGNTVEVRTVSPPSNATGWNVYVGFSPESLALQNTSPMSIDQVWSHLWPSLASGRPPGQGQLPNYFRSLPRVLQRG